MKKYRVFIYFAVFLITPIFFGIPLAMNTFVKSFQSRGLDAPDLKFLPSSRNISPNKTNVAVLLGTSATQTSDLLASFGILGKFLDVQIFTLSSNPKTVPLTSPFEVLPDFHFENAPPIDVLVIPSLLGMDLTLLENFLKPRLDPTSLRAPKIVTLGEGSLVLAALGYLNGKPAVTQSLSLNRARKLFPQVEWTESPWFTQETSERLTWATLRGGFLGHDALETLAPWILGQDRNPPEAPQQAPLFLRAQDHLFFYLHAAFFWHPTNLALNLDTGVNELALARFIEPLPRAFTARVVTSSPGRKWIESQYGLRLIPAVATENLPIVDVRVEQKEIPESLKSTWIPAYSRGFVERQLEIQPHSTETMGFGEALWTSFFESPLVWGRPIGLGLLAVLTLWLFENRKRLNPIRPYLESEPQTKSAEPSESLKSN